MASAPLLADALAHHRRGELDLAENLYRQIIDVSPRDVDAWHLLGVLAQQQGRSEAAIECIGHAIAHAAPHPTLYFNLGNALCAKGDFAAARVAYQRSIALRPDSAGSHVQLGAVHEKLNCTAEAHEQYRQAIACDAACAEAYFRLGNLESARGRLEEAASAFGRYTELRPDDARAYNNRANVLREAGLLDAAIENYERALAIDARCAEAHFNLGTAWCRKQNFDQAVGCYERFAALRPDYPEVYNRLAEVRLAQGQTDEAISQYRRALEFRPRNLLWHLRLDAIGSPLAMNNREIDEYRAALEQQLLGYRGTKFELDIADIPDSGGKPPIFLAYHGRDDRRLKSLFASVVGERLPQFEPPRNREKPHVGFVVTDGHEGVFLRGMAGVLNRLAGERFRITVVCGRAGRAAIAAAVSNPEVEYLTLDDNFPRALETLRAARFDLLYHWEIGTDSVNYFLPFFRLAAVQCASWGWPVTSGIPQVDYFVSSRLLEPHDAQQHYSERLVLLEHIPNYYDRPSGAQAEADREQFGFRASEHVYLCAQNPRKIHPDFDQLAAQILNLDPHGVLVLVEASRPHITQRLVDRLHGSLGVAKTRLRILPRMNKPQYMQLLSTADVALDTLHYGGGANTTYDTLAVGTPLVTLPGEFHRGRYAAAALQLMGLTDTIAENPADYVQRAVRIGTDTACRQDLKRRILAANHVLWGNTAAVAELQDFFERAIGEARQAETGLRLEA